ncbi:hypothetical protein BJ875DRAFT_438575 [Amylocarpus encephaloides]|uniref:SprT-like domain-containing protein n=1 Tax=Amylocarpus encephaloides TaxID=45428 RepID=A0A9P7YQK9_9HELO|nr:hypothetical protein BJ875DRAFT_438575 [Amylocarpus encephaloides]
MSRRDFSDRRDFPGRGDFSCRGGYPDRGDYPDRRDFPDRRDSPGRGDFPGRAAQGGGQVRHSERYPFLEEDDSAGREIRQFGYREANLLSAVRHISKEDPRKELSPYLQEVLYSPIPDLEEDDYLPVLEAWMQVFDQMYFYGLVCQNIKIKTSVNPSQPGGFGMWRKSDCHHINIYLHNHCPTPDHYTGRRLEWYIGVLLHEMTHAFLVMYSCECGRCKVEQTHERGGSGVDGHGPLWAEVMINIQEALQRHVRWHVCCSTKDSVEASMKTYGWTASSRAIEHWTKSDHRPSQNRSRGGQYF